MTITFCGAAREVTGSCYYVETSAARFLVDCGLFQGRSVADQKNADNFPFDPTTLDFVLLTHAHLDHCGRLPLLRKRGFLGPIYSTEPSIELTELILDDAAGLIEDEAREEGHDPLYTIDDTVKMADQFKAIGYHRPKKVRGVTFEYFDAGHILGSAFIKVSADNKTIAFSGDLGNPPVPLLPATEFLDQADFVVIESTYGNRRHEDFHLRKQRLLHALKTSIAQDGVLLIPAFAVERSQEILHEINDLVESDQLPFFPMFLDSPMAIKATEIYQRYPEFFNQHAVKELTTDDDLFSFPGLKMAVTKEQSKAINATPPPKVIMAGSGMMHGGRIRHHLKQYIGEKSCTLLIVGYMVEGSLGRHLLDGAKSIRIFGERHTVRASVTPIGAFSGHADQPKLLEWVGRLRHQPKTVFITHGEERAALALSESLNKMLHTNTTVPYLFDQVSLP